MLVDTVLMLLLEGMKLLVSKLFPNCVSSLLWPICVLNSQQTNCMSYGLLFAVVIVIIVVVVINWHFYCYCYFFVVFIK